MANIETVYELTFTSSRGRVAGVWSSLNRAGWEPVLVSEKHGLIRSTIVFQVSADDRQIGTLSRELSSLPR